MRLSVSQKLSVLAYAAASLLLVVGTAIALDMVGLIDLSQRAQGVACACLSSFIGVGMAARRSDELRREP